MTVDLEEAGLEINKLRREVETLRLLGGEAGADQEDQSVEEGETEENQD